jgi:exopolysaccharide biosynthesis WecB/TagA/CpsF family protein
VDAARQELRAVVDHMPVHGLVEAAGHPELMASVNTFDIVAPDGQPVRWALNLLHNTALPDRVYGPELMLRLCRRAAEESIGIYLYGSHLHVLEKLEAALLKLFPALVVAGRESPPFRLLTPQEDADVVGRMNKSGARLVFLGLGCPRQEIFAFEHRNRIDAIQVCVGAAFDFHAGNKRMAPKWMQNHGLEWLFRLLNEPRRLGPRYARTNSLFLLHLLAALARRRRVEHRREDTP